MLFCSFFVIWEFVWERGVNSVYVTAQAYRAGIDKKTWQNGHREVGTWPQLFSCLPKKENANKFPPQFTFWYESCLKNKHRWFSGHKDFIKYPWKLPPNKAMWVVSLFPHLHSGSRPRHKRNLDRLQYQIVKHLLDIKIFRYSLWHIGELKCKVNILKINVVVGLFCPQSILS